MDLGDYDPDLVEHLRELGATDEEILAAAQSGQAGSLSLELTLRPPGEAVTFDEAAARSGLDHTGAARLWRALGFADPGTDPSVRLAADEVNALTLLASGTEEVLSEGGALGLARVIGATSSHLAEAVVDLFRSEFEHPLRTGGVPYVDVVRQYSEFAPELLPAFLELFGAVLRRHLITVAAGSWSLDDNPTTRRELVVGFCDLVGYTSLSGRASPTELADLVTRFEVVVSDVTNRHRGRVVKLIGDAALFVCDEAAPAVAIGLDLIDELERDPSLPSGRVALAAGTVVTLRGDVYGTVVNLAARLLASADPGTLVVGDSVAEAAEGAIVTALPDRELKGFDEPQPAWAVRRA